MGQTGMTYRPGLGSCVHPCIPPPWDDSDDDDGNDNAAAAAQEDCCASGQLRIIQPSTRDDPLETFR